MNLKEVGHTIQIAGVIYNSNKEQETYLIMLPDEDLYTDENKFLRRHDFTLEQWEKFFWQTDVLEIEAKRTMYEKIIVRKAERQIAGGTSWAVYKRDGYTCRYCGKDGIPLTVDHVVLWEDGGPSIPENLVTSCKKCNRTRGDTPYPEWITSKVYLDISKGILPNKRLKNVALVDTLDNIPRSFTKMRGKKR
jgi:5-methylcytosine-specific restriction endonuclease McrA